VRGLRFANPNVGYAYGSTALYLTTNGGAAWSTRPGQADAIEVSNGTVLRISHDTEGCPPRCTYQVSTAAVGTTAWQPVDLPGRPLALSGMTGCLCGRVRIFVVVGDGWLAGVVGAGPVVGAEVGVGQMHVGSAGAADAVVAGIVGKAGRV
jgi:hypothetical protein